MSRDVFPIIWRSLIFCEIALQTETPSPIGDPSKEADIGSIIFAPDIFVSTTSLATRSLQITSDFPLKAYSSATLSSKKSEVGDE